MKMANKLSILVLVLGTHSAWSSPQISGNFIQELDGRWDIKCHSKIVAENVLGTVPAWYESLQEINFRADKTTEGMEFLNVIDSMPNVIGVLKLSLPVFYTQPWTKSSHTYFRSHFSSNSLSNEYHICGMEFDAFGRWGGSKPDFFTFWICSIQSWQNDVVKKQLTLINSNRAELKVTTQYGDPEEENAIECVLTR